MGRWSAWGKSLRSTATIWVNEEEYNPAFISSWYGKEINFSHIQNSIDFGNVVYDHLFQTSNRHLLTSPMSSRFSKTISCLLVLFKPPLLGNGPSSYFIEKTKALRRLPHLTITKSTGQSLSCRNFPVIKDLMYFFLSGIKLRTWYLAGRHLCLWALSAAPVFLFFLRQGWPPICDYLRANAGIIGIGHQAWLFWVC